MQPRSSDRHDTSPNNHYENDIRYTFQLCQWILKPIGVYPFVYSDVSKLGRAVSILSLIVCLSVIQFVMVPLGHFILFYEKDVNERIKLLGPIAFCTTAMIKYIYLCLKGPAFERCIKHVERDWRMLNNQDHRDIMIDQITMGRDIIKICAIFLYTGGLSYQTFVPLLSQMKTNENTTIRPLAYPGWEVFFEVQKSPTYEIVYFMHYLYVVVVGNITMAFYSLASIFISHACGQMKVQILRLENLMTEWVPKIRCQEDPLTVVVRDHAKVLRFTKIVGQALGEICLMDVLVSTILICWAEYHSMMELRSHNSIAAFTYMVLLTSFVFNILIFCYLGELLLKQGNNVAFASYGTGWYNMPAGKARGIVLLLAISKHPPKLTAGKIFDLSLTTFADVLKSSMVYLNMLRTITEP